MHIPPTISGAAPYEREPYKDAVIRTGVCVLLGIVGFWYPCWYDWRLGGSQVDSQAGFVLNWTLPIIFGYALYSTLTFRRAYRLTPVTNRLKRSFTIPSLALLCWLPFLWIVLKITWLIGYAAFEFGKSY